ncbi:hypothetical protein BKH41_02850 [Helicobacter sp. 12S02232-10]|uniref:hypothetical protein n=1 Tax=Helicobacter sp. 12S02232-10 TaxID=1476197 RepID=UPI000BA67ABC|nr:hypothetical protein [Helicobacter sp. 12S02232-10]PAF49619.1 hypothetical protein BKH41_02850 [Helicobacter sp. 12S02232-10]
MIEIKISPLPTPPSTKDALNFAERADNFVEALPQFQEELNKFAEEGNALKDELNAATQSLIANLNDTKDAGVQELQAKTQSSKTEIETKLSDVIDTIEKKVSETRLDELLNAYDEAKNSSITAIKSQQEKSEESLEAFKQESLESFQTSKEAVIGEILAQQKNPQDLEWKLLTAIASFLREQIKSLKDDFEERQRIGRKDYFFRNVLPENYVPMGIKLKAQDYPLLWYYTIGTAGNDRRNYFEIPKSNQYSKGTDITKEIGTFGMCGLPEIEININALLAGGSGNAFKTSWTNNYITGSGGSYPDNTLAFSASKASEVYGRSSEVEVNRVHYLEGVYAGKKQKSDQNKFRDFIEQIRKKDEQRLELPEQEPPLEVKPVYIRGLPSVQY